MKIEDCIPAMSKVFLSRVVDSFISSEVPRGDEDRLREQIIQSRSELATPERIAQAFAGLETEEGARILFDAISTSLLSSPDLRASYEDLFASVQAFEQSIIDESKCSKCLDLSDQKAIDIYKAVLEVALEDDEITPDERNLLERLRRKVKISRHEHRLLEAGLGKFPKPGNELHSHDDFKEALKQLQFAGVVFYCNRLDDDRNIVLPEEIAPGVKETIGFEMKTETQALLHESLTNEQLRAALLANGLPISGSKTERSERLIKAGCKPSEVLAALMTSDLAAICKKLQGVTVSGSKQERIDRIIDYFASLVSKMPESSDDPRAVYYEYLEEFAHRDNKNLYQMKLIKHDRDMERGFEEGTRYLFEVKLGQQLIEMPGTDHADGGVEFPNGELLLWDNKGKESVYTFPKSHLDQFRRYIRESVKRVSVFLVIVPEYDPAARLQALKLKHLTDTDSDVALISAADLKYVAEMWPKHSKEGAFSLEVFNATGILERSELNARMELFLS